MKEKRYKEGITPGGRAYVAVRTDSKNKVVSLDGERSTHSKTTINGKVLKHRQPGGGKRDLKVSKGPVTPIGVRPKTKK